MDLLRIATAGSVDDGKSTLIGRLLYDTGFIPLDKLEALDRAGKRKGIDYLDLSLLTDGLIAEREQGITIDVAHIYFSTPKRKYIIADTPGHVEYTRNMVTGTSTANASMILIDIRNGVLEQTHRHFYIACLLRVPHVVVCINKMDLVGYAEQAYNDIVSEFENFARDIRFHGQTIEYIPISALWGENVVERSKHMDWYQGPTLLGFLEAVAPILPQGQLPARFPIQSVIRPRTEAHHDYRAYAGKLKSGTLAVGDEVRVLPSGTNCKITRIERYDEDLEQAQPGQSVSISLDTDVDISRGDLIVKHDKLPSEEKEIHCELCWMDKQVLTSGKMYLLQHGTRLTKAKVSAIHSKIDTSNGRAIENPGQLSLNDIGALTLKVAQPIYADKYNDNPGNGAFILIDEFSNGTVGVGFVR